MHGKTTSLHRSKRGGFTLVELLVVIGIIALLISMLLPALNRVRRQAIVVQCASNMHNNGIALLNYATDNKGAFPQLYMNSENPTVADPVITVNWIWDMQVSVRNALLRYGASRATMYCPSNTEQNVNALWNFDVTATTQAGVTLFNGASGGGSFIDSSGKSWDGPPNMPIETGFGVMGYVWLIKRLDGGFPDPNAPPVMPFTTKWDYQTNIRPNNKPASNGTVRPNSSATTEISVDAVVSTNSLATPTFGNVQGGWLGHLHQSSHWYGGLPTGGNVLYMDGHVAWRNANVKNLTGVHMVRRTTLTGLNFWW